METGVQVPFSDMIERTRDWGRAVDPSKFAWWRTTAGWTWLEFTREVKRKGEPYQFPVKRLVPKGSISDVEFYFPGEEPHRNPYSEFIAIRDIDRDFLKFVERWGPLGRLYEENFDPGAEQFKKLGFQEAIEVEREEKVGELSGSGRKIETKKTKYCPYYAIMTADEDIEPFRSILRLVKALQDDDLNYINSIMEWRRLNLDYGDNDFLCAKGDIQRFVMGPHYSDMVSKSELNRWYKFELNTKDMRSSALAILIAQFNEALVWEAESGGTFFGLNAKAPKRVDTLQLGMSSQGTLKGLLLTRLGQAISSGAPIKSCKICRSFLPPAVSGHRSDRKYCSDACRMKAYRRNKKGDLATIK